MTDQSAIQLEVYSQSDPTVKLDVLPRRVKPTILEELKGPGGGSVIVPANDAKFSETPGLLDYRNVIKYRVGNKCVGAFVIQQTENSFVGTGEQAEKAIQYSGEGLRTWFHDASVYPFTRGSGWLGFAHGETRYFNFASPGGFGSESNNHWYKPSEWTTPVVVNNGKVRAKNSRWGTAPADWPDSPNASWIWDRASANVSAPVGDVYFRMSIIAEEATHSVFFAADNDFSFYVDGELKAESGVDDRQSWTTTTRVDVDLEAGIHTLAWKVHNHAGPAALLATVIRFGDPASDTASLRQSYVVEYTGGSNMRMRAYPAKAPGWNVGEVLLSLLGEAETRGVKFPTWINPTFTEDRDSNGVLWPDGEEWSFDIGTEYSDVLETMEEAGYEFFLDPETLDFHAYQVRGLDKSVFNEALKRDSVELKEGKNLLKASEEGTGHIKNQLLIQTDKGWVQTADETTNSQATYGRIEGSFAAGVSKEKALQMADAAFVSQSTPEISTAYTIIPFEGAVPGEDFNVGDSVLGPSAKGQKSSRRVVSLSMEENDAGYPTFALEFDAILKSRVKGALDTVFSTLPGRGNFNVPGGRPLQSSVIKPTPGKQILRVPKYPVGITTSQTGSWNTQGIATIDITVNWTPVTDATDNAPITIIGYEVWVQIGDAQQSSPYLAGSVGGDIYTTVIKGLARGGPNYRIFVKALAAYDQVSDLSDSVLVIPNAFPGEILLAPTKPTTSSKLGTVTVAWDGLLGGATPPPYFDFVTIQYSPNGTGSWVDIGTLKGAGFTVVNNSAVGATGYYRLYATDTLGRVSPFSANQAQIVLGVDLGNLDEDVANAIDAAKEAADVAKLTADAAQADADSALAAANTAQTAANGKNKTYYQPAAPTGTLVAGDLWFDTDDNYAPYRYNGTAWQSTRDLTIAAAQTQADSALTLAGQKNKSYYTTLAARPTTGLTIGDLWFDTANGYATYRYAGGTTWNPVQDSATALLNANTAQTTANSKNKVYYVAYASRPTTGLTTGDLLFDTAAGYKPYRYNGTTWDSVQDTSIATAQTAANTAQSTASGKNKIYYTTYAARPTTGLATGDLLFDTADGFKPYRYNGTAWDSVRDTTIATAQTAATNAATAASNAATAASTAQTAANNAQTAANNASTAAGAAQTTADGKGRVYSQTTAPTGNVNDLWIDTTGGANTPKRWNGTAWVAVTDKVASDAAVAAGNAQTAATGAQTTADGKNKTYYATTAPTGTLVEGDLWFDTANGYKPYRRTGGAWQAVQDASIAAAKAAADAAATAASNAQTSANGKNTTYYQNTAPTGSNLVSGDLWFDTANGFKPARYSGSAWVIVQDTSIATAKSAADAAATAASNAQTAATNAGTAASTAQTAANAAQTTADGKGRIWYQTTAPANNVNDLWIDTTGGANTPKRYNGTAWVSVTDKIATDAAAAAATATTLANTAQTTANGKTTTYYNSGAPSTPVGGFTIGDLWFDTANGFRPARWNGSGWITIQDTSIAAAQTAATNANTAAANAATAASNAATAAIQAQAAADTALASAPELVSNGSFELGSGSLADGWVLDSGVTIAGSGHTGVRRLNLSVATAGLGATSVSPISLTPGQRLRISGWSTVGGTAFRGAVRLVDASGVAIAGMAAALPFVTSTWTKGSADVTVPAGVTSAYVRVERTSASNSGYVDDVSILDISDAYAALTAAQAAQTTATNAQTAAGNAATAAATADGKATTAQTTANGKNKLIWSTAVASGTTGYVAGDLWYRRDASNQIIGIWEYSGSAWTARTLTDSVVTNLSAATITTGTLAAARIAAGSLNASVITSNTITAAQIAANTITATQIATGTITAASGVIGSIDAGVISVGVIDAARIAAQSINVSKLMVSDFTNLVDDPGFEYYPNSSWATGVGATVVSTPTGRLDNTTKVLQVVASGSISDSNFNAPVTARIPVQEGDQFYGEVWVRALAGALPAPAGGAINLAATIYTPSGTASYPTFFTLLASQVTTDWVKYSGTIVIPAGYNQMVIRVSVRNSITSGTIQFDDIVVRRKNGGELIVDGSIGTNSLSANAVTAAKIAAGTITASEIASNAITSVKIAADAVTAAKILAGTITATEIAGGTITAAKIAGGTITAAQIAGGTITATQIAAGTITSASGVFGTVDAGVLTTGTLNAARIAAASISGDKLQANTITAREIIIGDFTNFASGADFEIDGASPFDLNDTTVNVVSTQANTGTKSLQFGPASYTRSRPLLNSRIPVQPGDVFYFELAARKDSTFNGGGGNSKLRVGSQSGALLLSLAYGTGDLAASNTWYTKSATYTVPASGVTSLQVAIGADNTVGNLWIDDVIVRRKTPGQLIIDGSIQAAQIATGSITSASGVIGALDAGTITTGILSASRIAANSISTGQLLVTNMNNMIEDPSFEANNGLGWTVNSNATITTTNPRTSGRALAMPAQAAAYQAVVQVNYIQVEAGEKFTYGAWIRSDSASASPAGAVELGMMWGSTTSTSTANTAAQATAVSSTSLGTAYQYIWGTYTVPSGVKYLRPRIVMRDITTTQTYYIDDLVFYKQASADLIVDGAITAAKIAVDAVTADKIVAGTITATELASNSITSVKIAADAVTAAKILAGTITAAEIAAGTITGAKLVAGTITGTQIAADAITAVKIASGTVTANEIAAGTLTSASGVFGTIDAGSITAGTLSASRIGALSITTGMLAADAVTAAKIAAGTITATEIATGAINADKIQANAVTTAKINTNAVTANEIATGTITATEIAGGTITAAKIASGTITGALIAGTTITAGNLVAGTLTSASGVFGAVDAGILTAGTINAARIAAASITADKMIIGDFTNLLDDPGFEVSTLPGWANSGTVTTTTAAGTFRSGARAAAFGTGARSLVSTNAVPVKAGDQFYLSVWYRHSATPAGTNGGIRLKNQSNVDVASTGFSTSVGAWTQSTVTYTVPASGVTTLRAGIATATTTGTTYVDDFEFRRMATGELIVDGSIRTNHMVANTINASVIQSGTITTNKIGANQITANEIATGTITANEINLGTLNGQIITGAIIQTSSSGNRVVMNSGGLVGYDGGGVERTRIGSTGYLTASFVTLKGNLSLVDQEIDGSSIDHGISSVFQYNAWGLRDTTSGASYASMMGYGAGFGSTQGGNLFISVSKPSSSSSSSSSGLHSVNLQGSDSSSPSYGITLNTSGTTAKILMYAKTISLNSNGGGDSGSITAQQMAMTLGALTVTRNTGYSTLTGEVEAYEFNSTSAIYPATGGSGAGAVTLPYTVNDRVFGVPNISGANSRDATIPTPAKGDRVWNIAMMWEEAYFTQWSTSNREGANPAGWYPVAGKLPMFVGSMGSGTSLPNASFVTLPCGTVEVMSGTNIFGGTAGNATIIQAGVYMIVSSFTVPTGGTARIINQLVINGVGNLYEQAAVAVGGTSTLQNTQILSLDANSTIQFRARQDEGVTRTLQSARISIQYLGPPQ